MTTKTETLVSERDRVRALETQNTHLLAQLHAAQSSPEVSHTGGPQGSQTPARTTSPGVPDSGAPQSKVPGEHASREREADVEAEFVDEFVGTLSLPRILSLSLPPLSSSEASRGEFVGEYREGSEEEMGGGERDSDAQAEEEEREGVLLLLSGEREDPGNVREEREEERERGQETESGGEREERGGGAAREEGGGKRELLSLVRSSVLSMEEQERGRGRERDRQTGEREREMGEEREERDRAMQFLEREVEREHVLRTDFERALR
jgi:hypothetical protein